MACVQYVELIRKVGGGMMIPGILAQRRHGGGGGGGGDPYWANVFALLHMDGTEGSTTFPNQKGGTATVNGAVSVSTAQSRFGGASGLFSGGRLGLGGPNLSGDFTIEGWIYPTALGSNRSIAGIQTGSTNIWMYLVSDGRLAFSYGNYNANGGKVTLNTWHHVAFTRLGTKCSVFLNGQEVSYTFASAVTVSGPFLIGQRANGTTPFAGHIDEFRITVGVARYTGNFTPPDTPFPDS